MMKNFKLYLLNIALIAGFFTSCTNNDSIVEEQNIDKTEAITESLNRLAQQFNDDGNVITSVNPSGNIVFDYCFDFVYPLNLSYNNGTTVSVSSLDDLITILINSTNNLYIDGVEFPFDVETYNGSGAIEVVTINDENEFYDLLESCDFESIDTCECFEVFDPVCVEIQAPDGESFIITYPNECYAICDGFTSDDFVDNCTGDYNNPGGNGCFEFVFPLTIVTDENQTITVNSQEELDNELYNAYYFDFVYSFDVTVNDELLTIGNEEAFIALLEYCFNYEVECDIDIEFLEDTLMICDFFYEIEIFNQVGEIVDVNYVNFNQNNEIIVNGTPAVTDIGFWNIMCIDNNVILTIDEVLTFTQLNGDWALIENSNENLIFTNNEGYVININLDCESNNPSDCSEQEVFDYLLLCNWYINTSLYNTVNAEYAQFYQDGSLEIFSEGSNSGLNGTWDLTSNPVTGDVFIFFNVTNSPSNLFNELDWTVTQCSEEFMLLESGNEFIQLARECENTNTDCTPNTVLPILLECPWSLNGTTYTFTSDNTITIIGGGASINGSWSIYMGNEGYPIVVIYDNTGNVYDEWSFVDCNLINSLIVLSSQNPSSQIELDCD